MYVKPGSTEVSVYFVLQDSVTGGPFTATGGETSLNLIYQRPGAVQVAANVSAALGSADAAHEDGKVFHCGNGIWRCDFADAAFAAGADHVLLMVTHDSGSILPAVVRVDLGLGEAALEAEIDSTGSGLTARKALEALVAVLAGKSSFSEETGQASFQGRDGQTEIVSVTVSDVGTRSASTIS